ncbi:hypothetical protein LJC20_03220 [Eubacteriales bacterium OttesenSCG-928-M02]|nr:hypothetical protein [Eubacteriales bacterium OttesenSCG-928-M02]
MNRTTKKQATNILAVVFLFFFIYAIKFTFLPVSTAKIVVGIGIISIALLLVKKQFVMPFSWKALRPSLLILILGIYSICISLLNKSGDYNVPYAYLLFIVEHILGSLIFVELFAKKEMFTRDWFFKCLIATCTIQAIIILMMLFSPALRYSIINITNPSLLDLNIRYGGIRGLGLAVSTTYDLSLLQSMGIILVIYLLPKSKKDSQLVGYAAITLVLLVSVLLSGRTGYIGLFFAALFLIWQVVQDKNARQATLKYILYFIIIILIVALVFSLFAPAELFYTITVDANIYVFEMFYNLFGISPQYAEWLQNHQVNKDSRVFNIFISRVPIWGNESSPNKDNDVEQYHGLTTDSTEVLKKMYFNMPLKTWLIGDGYYLNKNGDGYYMSTDAGYMRHILYYGLAGSLLLATFYIWIFVRMIKSALQQKNASLTLLLSMFFLLIFCVHLKGDILLGSGMIIKVILLLYFVIYRVNESCPK